MVVAEDFSPLLHTYRQNLKLTKVVRPHGGVLSARKLVNYKLQKYHHQTKVRITLCTGVLYTFYTIVLSKIRKNLTIFWRGSKKFYYDINSAKSATTYASFQIS